MPSPVELRNTPPAVLLVASNSLLASNSRAPFLPVLPISSDATTVNLATLTKSPPVPLSASVISPLLLIFKSARDPSISIVPTDKSPIELRVIAPSASALTAPEEVKLRLLSVTPSKPIPEPLATKVMDSPLRS